MYLIEHYPTIEGFKLPSDSYYSIPNQYKHLPIKEKKYQITNWEWYKITHPYIKHFLQSSPHILAGVKHKGSAPLGMFITKAGNNWPLTKHVPVNHIIIKRVNYYHVIHDIISDTERYPRLIIREVDDVAYYIGPGAQPLVKGGISE